MHGSVFSCRFWDTGRDVVRVNNIVYIHAGITCEIWIERAALIFHISYLPPTHFTVISHLHITVLLHNS